MIWIMILVGSKVINWDGDVGGQGVVCGYAFGLVHGLRQREEGHDEGTLI